MQLYTCRAWGSWNWTIIFVVLSLSSFQVPHTSCMLVYMGLTPPLSLNWTSSSKKKKKLCIVSVGSEPFNYTWTMIIVKLSVIHWLWIMCYKVHKTLDQHISMGTIHHTQTWFAEKKKLLLTPFTLPQFCCISSKACCIVFHVHSRLFQLWQVFFALGKCLQQLTVNSR